MQFGHLDCQCHCASIGQMYRLIIVTSAMVDKYKLRHNN